MKMTLYTYTFKVWTYGALLGMDAPTLTLHNPNALHFFLESLAHGNAIFPGDQPFEVALYRDGLHIFGSGTYCVHYEDVGLPATWLDPEPVKLHCLVEQGEIVGVMQTAWRNMLENTGLVEEWRADVERYVGLLARGEGAPASSFEAQVARLLGQMFTEALPRYTDALARAVLDAPGAARDDAMMTLARQVQDAMILMTEITHTALGAPQRPLAAGPADTAILRVLERAAARMTRKDTNE